MNDFSYYFNIKDNVVTFDLVTFDSLTPNVVIPAILEQFVPGEDYKVRVCGGGHHLSTSPVFPNLSTDGFLQILAGLFELYDQELNPAN